MGWAPVGVTVVAGTVVAGTVVAGTVVAGTVVGTVVGAAAGAAVKEELLAIDGRVGRGHVGARGGARCPRWYRGRWPVPRSQSPPAQPPWRRPRRPQKAEQRAGLPSVSSQAHNKKSTSDGGHTRSEGFILRKPTQRRQTFRRPSSPPPLIARQTFSAVHGMSIWRTPRCAIASTTALCTAAVEPIVPDSPMPFAPSGLTCVGVTV